MATYNQTLPVNQTLAGTGADLINVTNPAPSWIKVTNRDATNTLWVKGAGAVPVASDQTVIPVLPLKDYNLYIGGQIIDGSTKPVVQVVGNGGGYSIYGGVQ